MNSGGTQGWVGKVRKASELSGREREIVELAIRGLTNETISQELGLSTGTVNTYWMRIRSKVGGQARTDTIAKILFEQADRALQRALKLQSVLALQLDENERLLRELRSERSLLQFALKRERSTVWSTDRNLRLQVVSNGELPSFSTGVHWERGKTVYEVFKCNDPRHPVIAAHLAALKGKETVQKLDGDFSQRILTTLPMGSAEQPAEIQGCIGILNTAA